MDGNWNWRFLLIVDDLSQPQGEKQAISKVGEFFE
jgi:hypothetical protein